jgi:SulP family sulfate permease
MDLTRKFQTLPNPLQPNLLVSAIVAGMLIGVLTIIQAISFGTLIFSGDLSVYVQYGISISLFTAFLSGIIIALTSSFPGTIGIPLPSAAALLAVLASSISSRLSPTDAVFETVAISIALGTLLTGLFFIVLERLNLSRLIRFLPYPVTGGFLAGVGWLFVKGAILVMTDIPLSFNHFSLLLAPDTVPKWLSGIVLAILLMIVMRRYKHYFVMPTVLFGAMAFFYLVLFISGTTMGEAASNRWLLQPAPGGISWQPLSLSILSHANWSVILGEAGRLGTLLIICIVSLLLQANSLELVVKQDIDLNRELKAAGITNIISGIAGGIVGCLSLSQTTLAIKMGANQRITGLLSAMLCGVPLFFGTAFIAVFPKPILGGLLMYLGFSYLFQWLYEARAKLPRDDYLIVVLILIVIATWGFIEGVGIGIVITVILFAVKYSQIEVVKHKLSGENFQSNVDRPTDHLRLLRKNGDQIYILKLQGFLFFGTSYRLLEKIRARLQDKKKQLPRFVILDFRAITGIDSSAVHSFIRMKQISEAQQVTLLCTNLSPELSSQLERGGFIEDHSDKIYFFKHVDYALEWCETHILASEISKTDEKKWDLQTQLKKRFSDSEDVLKTIKYFKKMKINAGDYLIKQGDPAGEMYFLESGQLKVELQLENGETIRLRTMSHGTIVGEVALLRDYPRTASIIAEQSSTVYLITKEALEQMKREEPEIGTSFHFFIATILAERLANQNKALLALLD